MRKLTNKAFTLVELLVVITILAIISVVAYQSFGWATDKAISARKISDVSTIESSLQQYKVDKKFYPAVDIVSSNNMWWYDSSKNATASNTISVSKNWAEITAVISATGGWKIYWSGSYSNKQIWAKWTISQNTLWKQYLTKDLFDPEISDIKIWSETMIDKWIWRYVYAVFKKPLDADTDWTDNKEWTYYNIAYTIKKEWSDTFITKIVWDYDINSCFDNKNDCPGTLIWNQTDFLIDNQENSNSDVNVPNQWIPYPVNF
jgi:prepilin-type N-terminal cleavage/methylation domain-containing protein